MAIKSSRGVTSGKGTPQRLEGQNGDITIRTTPFGKKLFVKDANKWHSVNLDVNTSDLHNKINALLKDVRSLKNSTRNRPVLDSAILRKPGAANIQLKNNSGALNIRNAADDGNVELSTTYTAAKVTAVDGNTGAVTASEIKATALTDATAGVLTPSKAIVVDSNKAISNMVVSRTYTGALGGGTHNLISGTATVDSTSGVSRIVNGISINLDKTSGNTTGYTMNVMDLQVDGSSKLKVNDTGAITSTGTAENTDAASGDNRYLHITSSGEIGYRTAATLKGDIGGTAASSTFTDVTIDGAGGLELKNGSTGPGFIKFFEDSDNGTNAITLIGPASTADATLTLPSTAGTLLTEFTVAATTNTNPTTIVAGDTLTIAASTGITTTATSDGTITIGNTMLTALVNYVNKVQPQSITGTKTFVKTHTTTSSDDIYPLKSEINHSGNAGNGASINNIGFDVDVNYTGTNSVNSNVDNIVLNFAVDSVPSGSDPHPASTVDNFGIKGVLTGHDDAQFAGAGNWSGNNQTGIDLTITGAQVANQTGILLNTQDGSTDLKIVSSADTGDYFTIATTTHGATTIATEDDNAEAAHITLDADGDIILDCHIGKDILIQENGGEYIPTADAHVATKKYVDDNAGGGGASALNDLSDVTYSSGDLTISSLDKIIANDFVVDSAASIELDANNGNFAAKRAGTEFSVANSAYAGMIIGYQMIGESAMTASKVLTTSYQVTNANHRVKFIAPPSGNVEIEVQIYRNSSSSNKVLYLALSDNSTYNSIGVTYEQRVSFADETDDFVVRNKWVVTGLTAGNAYEYWLAAKTSGTNLYLQWGGNTSGVYADFIMKATALPAATSEFAVYD